MKLKEKFYPYCDNEYSDKWVSAENCEDVADEFAIRFAEWTWNKELITVNDCDYFEYKFNLYTRKELLEIYKKEKGL